MGDSSDFEPTTTRLPVCLAIRDIVHKKEDYRMKSEGTNAAPSLLMDTGRCYETSERGHWPQALHMSIGRLSFAWLFPEYGNWQQISDLSRSPSWALSMKMRDLVTEAKPRKLWAWTQTPVALELEQEVDRNTLHKSLREHMWNRRQFVWRMSSHCRPAEYLALTLSISFDRFDLVRGKNDPCTSS